MEEGREREWRPSGFHLPEADNALNPAHAGRPVSRSSIGEIIEWHTNAGTMDETVREYCGLPLRGGRDR
jgi:hypothetical protein